MNVTIEEVSPVERRVTVEIEWPHVAAKLDEAYRELGRGVAIRGFRKGKVPRNILEQMFARQVEREVAEKLVQESFLYAARQHELRPVAEPIVDELEMKKGTGFRYSARIEVRAPVEPKDYEGVALERPEPKVTDEDIKRALEHKRDELTEYKRIEGRTTLAPSDVAVVDFTGEVGGKPLSREGMVVDLGAPEKTAFPGLGPALHGASINAQGHEVAFDTPAEGEAAGRTPVRLKVTVKEAREKIVPALDDDFAKDTGEADTLAELREKLRGKLLILKEREVNEELRKELVKELLHRNPFPVPAALVERQSDVMVQRAKLGLAFRGIDPRAMPIDETKLRNDLRPAATDEVRALFLIEAIADKEKVEVTEAELEKQLAEMAKDREKSVPRLKAELQKEDRLDGIRHQLREEKTLDLLLTRANITRKS